MLPAILNVPDPTLFTIGLGALLAAVLLTLAAFIFRRKQIRISTHSHTRALDCARSNLLLHQFLNRQFRRDGYLLFEVLSL